MFKLREEENFSFEVKLTFFTNLGIVRKAHESNERVGSVSSPYE